MHYLIHLKNPMRYINKITRYFVGFLFNFNAIVFYKRFSRKVKRFSDKISGKKTAIEIAPYNNDKVTMIIVIDNDSDNFQKSLESALSQTYNDLEVIAVIDPSYTMGVMNILQGFITNPRFKLFIHQPYKGISSALNAAIIDSTGDWISVLNSNDWMEDDAIQKLMNELKSKSGTIFGFSELLNNGKEQAGDKNLFPIEYAGKYIFSTLLKYETLSFFSIINKKVFLSTGLYDSRFDGVQDYDIALKSAFHFPDSSFVYLPEILHHHQITEVGQVNPISDRIKNKINRIREEARLRIELRDGVFDKLVSFVILSYEKKEMTIKCIENIQSLARMPYEIILFDNGSLPESQEFLRAHLVDAKNVYVTFSDKNLGCPGGRHEAVKKAKGDYIIYLDNDIFITEGWIEELLITAKSDEKVMAVTSKTVFPDGKVQFNGGKYQIRDGFIKFTLIDFGLNETDIRTAQWHSCDWVPGGATLFKKEIINKIDFSAGYINAFEDNDVALQIHNLGYKVVNCPCAKVVHNHIYYDDKKTKTEKRYLKGRYNNEGLILSFLNFYKRNNLILEDTFIYSLFSLNGKSNEKKKAFVNNLLKEYKL